MPSSNQIFIAPIRPFKSSSQAFPAEIEHKPQHLKPKHDISMAQIWALQPLKAIYTIFILLTTPPYAMLLYLRYLVKPSHPDCE